MRDIRGRQSLAIEVAEMELLANISRGTCKHLARLVRGGGKKQGRMG